VRSELVELVLMKKRSPLQTVDSHRKKAEKEAPWVYKDRTRSAMNDPTYLCRNARRPQPITHLIDHRPPNA
jgi:hypothetical protein